MITAEHITIWGFEHAIRGMRNPLNSWKDIDSKYEQGNFVVGPQDLALMRKLFKGGPDHRKFARQIFVSLDITAPLYWWKEFDTYKVGTVTNSCSTMHKLMEREFVPEDFSMEYLEKISPNYSKNAARVANSYRTAYLNYNEMKTEEDEFTKKDIWYALVQLLPCGYNQRRTVTMNYENVFTMIKQRGEHKLKEWLDFVDILKNLPYVKEIMTK